MYIYANNREQVNFMKLLDQVKIKIKFKHYSPYTENTYVYWIKKYILYHHKRHQKDMGEFEIEQFLSHLASIGQVIRFIKKHSASYGYRENG